MYDVDGENNMVNRGGGGYGGAAWMGGIWIFALVILALFFLFSRDGHKHGGGYGEAVIPALALGNAGHKSTLCMESKLWDVERDQMREFANVRDEIKEVGWRQSSEAAKYFYDNRTATDKSFFDQAMLTQQVRHEADMGFARVDRDTHIQTREILARIDKMENDMKDKEIQQLTSKINFLETIQGVRGLGIPPAYPVHPPTQMGFSHC